MGWPKTTSTQLLHRPADGQYLTCWSWWVSTGTSTRDGYRSSPFQSMEWRLVESWFVPIHWRSVPGTSSGSDRTRGTWIRATPTGGTRRATPEVTDDGAWSVMTRKKWPEFSCRCDRHSTSSPAVEGFGIPPGEVGKNMSSCLEWTRKRGYPLPFQFMQ